MFRLIVLGILLAATAIDANGCLFPLAHTVVDAENDNNWLWFLHLLLTVVQSHALQSLIDKALVFLSDRQKGLVEGVEKVFVGCPHGYCLKHLEANLIKEFKNSKLSEFLWKAASATTQPMFDKALEDMAKINPKSVFLGYYCMRNLSTGRNSTSMDVVMAISPQTLQNLSIH